MVFHGREELRGHSLPPRRPPQRRHVPGLVDENQPISFDAILIPCAVASPRHVETIALASHQAFLQRPSARARQALRPVPNDENRRL